MDSIRRLMSTRAGLATASRAGQLPDAGNAPLQPDSGATNGIEIGLAGAATNMLIGGDVAGAGNVVLMNNVGINLHANSSANVTMQGNLINTNAAGSALLGYTQLGINAQDTVPGVGVEGGLSRFVKDSRENDTAVIAAGCRTTPRRRPTEP
jgi:hypothetical protein